MPIDLINGDEENTGVNLLEGEDTAARVPGKPKFSDRNFAAEATRFQYAAEGLDIVHEGEDFSALLNQERGKILRTRMASLARQDDHNRKMKALDDEFKSIGVPTPEQDADLRNRALALQNPPYDPAHDPEATLEDAYTGMLTIDTLSPEFDNWEEAAIIENTVGGPSADDVNLKTGVANMKQGMLIQAHNDLAGQALLQTAIEEIQDRREERWWVTGAYDFLKDGLPFRTYLQTVGLGSDTIKGALNDLRSRYDRADMEGKKAIIKEVMDSAWSYEGADSNLFNPEFILSYLMGPSSGMRVMADLTNVMDFIPVVGAGAKYTMRASSKAAGKVGNALAQAQVKQAGVAKLIGYTANTKTGGRLQRWLDYFKGDDLDAAVNSVLTGNYREPAQNLADVMEESYSILSPKHILNGQTAETLGNAMRNTKEAIMSLDMTNPKNIFRQLQEQVTVNRIVPDSEVLARVKDTVYKTIKELNPRWEDRVIDLTSSTVPVDTTTLRVLPRTDGPKQTYKIDILLGDEGGKLFDSVETAKIAAKQFFGLDSGVGKAEKAFDFHLTDNGKVAIVLTHEIDETTPGFRDAIKIMANDSPDRVTPSSSLFGSLIRSRNETTSVASSKAVLTAEEGQTRLLRDVATALNDSWKKMSRGDKGKFKDWVNKFHANPKAPINTLNEFKVSWAAHHNELPSDAAMATFIRYNNQNLANWVLLNESKRLDLARAGYRMWGFSYKTAGGVTVNMHGKILGKLMAPGQGIPWSAEEMFNVAYFKRGMVEGDEIPQLSNYKFAQKEKKFKKAEGTYSRKEFDQALQKGAKLIKLNDDGQELISSLPKKFADQLKNNGVKFLLIDDATMSNLPQKVVPFKPGFHRMMKYDSYLQAAVVKQAEDGTRAHVSDIINLMNFRSKSHGAQYLNVINEARKRYLWAKDLPQGRAMYELWRKKNVAGAFNWGEMKNLEERGLDFKAPWVIKKEGEDWTPAEINNMYGNKFQKVSMGGIKSSFSDISEISDLSKALKRDDRLKTMERTNASGTKGQPHYQAVDAEILNPIDAVRRQTAAMIHGRAMDDLKMRAAAEFSSMFGHLASENIQRVEIDKNPYYFLMNRNALKAGSDFELNQAKSYQRAMYEVFRSQTQFDEWYQNNVVASIAEWASVDMNMFKQGAHLMAEFMSPDNLAGFMKGLTFNLGLGLFNPKQLLLQGSQFASAAAIVGDWKMATNAGFHYFQMRHWLRNPEKRMRQHWSNLAFKETGLSQNKFEAMADAFDRSGFHIVGNNTIFKDSTNPNEVMRNARLGDNIGLTFFKGGEQFNRGTAWSLAAQEWFKKNPTFSGNRLPDEAITDILYRANLISGNMLSASKASWQRGLLGVPTQYWAFNSRLVDMYWGKALQPKEKARLFAQQMMMYGWPAAIGSLGGAVNVRRLYDSNFLGIRGSENVGLDPENDNLFTWLNEGGLAMSLRMFGADVDADSFGADGLNLGNMLWESIQRDSTDGLFELFVGASGRTVGSIFGAIGGAWDGISNAFNSTADWEDILPIIQSASGLSNMQKAYWIWKSKAIYTKRGEEITIKDADMLDAALQVLGFPNHRVADFYTMKNLDYLEKQVKQTALTKVRQLGKKAMDPSTSPDEMERLMKKSIGLMNSAGFDSPKEQAETIRAFMGSKRTNFQEYIERAGRAHGTAAEERKRKFLEQQGNQ